MMTNEAVGISLLDHSLNAMLMLSYVALHQGDAVGLICFSDQIHTFVPPRGGMNQMNRLLHAAFDRFPQLVESRYDEAFLYLTSRCKKRSLVVLITNVIDEVNANQIQRWLSTLSGRHLPLGVLLRDHQLFDAANLPQPTRPRFVPRRRRRRDSHLASPGADRPAAPRRPLAGRFPGRNDRPAGEPLPGNQSAASAVSIVLEITVPKSPFTPRKDVLSRRGCEKIGTGTSQAMRSSGFPRVQARSQSHFFTASERKTTLASQTMLSHARGVPPLPQHFLYFFPLPQGQGSFRPTRTPPDAGCSAVSSSGSSSGSSRGSWSTVPAAAPRTKRRPPAGGSRRRRPRCAISLTFW